jgi:hypothetical protein
MSDREVEYVGAGLKLECPAPISEIVSVLFRGGGNAITYKVPGSQRLPWPPDPTQVDYGEPCLCDVCGGRLVGATVEELRDEIAAISSNPAELENTYTLRYQETSRDLVIRAARNSRYGFHRDISTFTDTYVGTTRRVAVRYDGGTGQEVVAVNVVQPPNEGEYPASIAGALAALRGEN